MNKKELVELLLENFVNEKGDLDLRDLDFSDFDGNVFIGRMKVKCSLNQGSQKVEGDLWQDNQEIKRNLFQEEKKNNEKSIKIN